jgi:hypothetical protein
MADYRPFTAAAVSAIDPTCRGAAGTPQPIIGKMKKQSEKRLADRLPPDPSNPRGDVGD